MTKNRFYSHGVGVRRADPWVWALVRPVLAAITLITFTVVHAQGVPAQPMVAKPGGGVRCQPAVASRDGVLILEFGFPHPAELAIVRPDKESFSIAERRLPPDTRGRGAVTPSTDAHPRLSSMPPELFASIIRMEVSVQDFQARRSRVGAPPMEPVFTAPGRYQILLGDALESDTEVVVRCPFTIKN